MAHQRTERDKAWHQQRVVVWGRDIHRTPAGTNAGCVNLGELFTRAAIQGDQKDTR